MCNPTTIDDELPSRSALRSARRVCIKAGTSVVANEDGRPSLTRLGSLAEQIAELNRNGVQVLLVSSGAVGMGRRVLRNQSRMNMTFLELASTRPQPISNGLRHSESSTGLLSNSDDGDAVHTEDELKSHYDSACAAAGQFDMMNLYSSMFAQADVSASQILVTQADFGNEHSVKNLKYAVERLLNLGIVPIINENDAVSGGYVNNDVFSDNDSLAALCARTFGAEVLLLLTDVDGVFDSSPKENPNAKLLSFYHADSDSVEIGTKSNQGRGGMGSKIEAATDAVAPGSKCLACVVSGGSDLNAIRSILGPSPKYGQKGTLFVTPGTDLEKQALLDTLNDEESVSDDARNKATTARNEARKLMGMPYSVRQNIMYAICDALLERQDELLAANLQDIEAAELNGISMPLRKRLVLTQEKLQTLADGIRSIADKPDPLNVVQNKRELSDGLVLSQVTVPIGCLMVIFESRPDSMPQIAALALASGNGLLLKGGKEASHSNAAIHEVISEAIEQGSGGLISGEIIALMSSRGQVADMLALDDTIDLVIPRGSNALVQHIKNNTRIPVLGHADGVCHMYIDETADADTAARLAVDAKTDYPSACNAIETLLLHKAAVHNGVASQVLMSLRAAGVKCLGGPSAMQSGLSDVAAEQLKCEYGDLTLLVEVVDSTQDAIDWIHTYGSGHTEVIVCRKDAPAGEVFLQQVDAACVFQNASSRFADGYRFGLGAEVGISTGRIHSRGPVGVEGLLTTKWQLRSEGVDTVAEFSGPSPKKVYTHKELKC